MKRTLATRVATFALMLVICLVAPLAGSDVQMSELYVLAAFLFFFACSPDPPRPS